ALAWGLDALSSGYRYRQRFAWAAAVVLLFVLARASYAQLGYWRDPVELWVHTIEATDNNYTAHSNLADVLMHQGRVAESLAESGRFSDAITLAEQALSLARASSNTALVNDLNLNLANYHKRLSWRDPGIKAPP